MNQRRRRARTLLSESSDNTNKNLLRGTELSARGEEEKGHGNNNNNNNNRRRRQLFKNINLDKMDENKGLTALVVPISFSDHDERDVIDTEDLVTLFTATEPDADICVTGSVNQYFLDNSNDEVSLDAIVMDWIDLDDKYTEAYCAGGKSGLDSIVQECLKHALTKVEEAMKDDMDEDEEDAFTWDDLDLDGNKVVDMVVFVHSGYGAEFGGTDHYNSFYTDRIWSHAWELDWPTTLGDGIVVNHYAMVSSLHGFSNRNIVRVGTLVHEIFSSLGLPVMYDGYNGQGIGSFDAMANSWGMDGTGHYPPMLSAWTRHALNWIEIIDIDTDGMYELPASAITPRAFKISNGFPVGEYLLLENRQAKSFDGDLAVGGLAVYHVDEDATWTEEGHPEQQGWPENGKHYRVALLSAEGSYAMEKNEDRGDHFDLFRKGGRSSIGPDGISPLPFGATEAKHPNTNTYQDGVVKETGVRIFEIGFSEDLMTFEVSFDTEIN
eukprot:CAMPEP_0118705968 /NCGR_PEP_ID=MMETSP0800-20121206/20242_1 /TAXON_ID=210618 ORGANISM="Striatella unipunctata, Strain CCMP2910" /NCGR_SAMPLE_ID=MMETSP0800 /ASSEMBLY_ACC=CAM_ASM_000638 /LENGTH=493 /DNA_ID=CAMNT_0006608341 /DNA_START=121 /DNA_END=1602 /DNA_ORIENTATION=+